MRFVQSERNELKMQKIVNEKEMRLRREDGDLVGQS